MNKQKAIEVINDAPVGWGFYNELTYSFFARVADIWYIYEGGWIAHNPNPKADISMIPKSEILKIALEGEEMKNAGDNLILGCEQDFKKARAVASYLRKDMGCSDELLAKGDEWPKIGDDVCWSNGCYKGVVKARHWNDLWVMESCGEFSTLYVDDVSKPKTPEEELREWMQERIGNGIANGFDCEQITHDLLHHLNITKKPQ